MASPFVATPRNAFLSPQNGTPYSKASSKESTPIKFRVSAAELFDSDSDEEDRLKEFDPLAESPHSLEALHGGRHSLPAYGSEEWYNDLRSMAMKEAFDEVEEMCVREHAWIELEKEGAKRRVMQKESSMLSAHQSRMKQLHDVKVLAARAADENIKKVSALHAEQVKESISSLTAYKEKEREAERQAAEAARKKIEMDAAAAKAAKEEAERKAKQKAEEESRAKEVKSKEAPSKQAVPAPASASASAPGGGSVVAAPQKGATAAGGAGGKSGRATHVAWARSLKEKIADLKTKADVMANATDMPVKRTRMAIKKKINTAINAIASSRSQIRNCSNGISSSLMEAKGLGSDGYYYALHLAVTKLVEQVPTLITSNVKAAWPTAEVIYGIAIQTQDESFLDYVLGEMLTECVYLAPQYHKRKEGQSEADYKKAMGYKPSSAGTDGFEAHDSYFDRMACYASLYAAITTVQGNTLHGVDKLWGLLARILNRDPRNVTAPVVIGLLKVGGYDLAMSYGRQFQKMVRYIDQVYTPKLSDDPVLMPYNARLSVWTREYWDKGGRLDMPEGKDMPEVDASRTLE